MKRGFVLLSLILLLSIVSACQPQSENVEKITGKDLAIAIIGELPSINEKNVTFTKVGFEALESSDSTYDAVFIMEDSLDKAAEVSNITRFKESDKPIFFIGSKASYIPFIETENPLTYKEYAERTNFTDFEVSGIIFVDNETGYRSFAISVPVKDETLSNDNKKKIYTEVFKAIRTNKLHKGGI